MKVSDHLKTVFRVTALLIILMVTSISVYPQKIKVSKPVEKSHAKNQRIFYGQASFYSNKFQGRRTADGSIFDQNKYTAACNVLPLGTWIRVTNVKNGKSVVVKTTDRLHPKMRRLVDLSKVAAKKLDYISKGLTRVKVEVLNKKPGK